MPVFYAVFNIFLRKTGIYHIICIAITTNNSIKVKFRKLLFIRRSSMNFLKNLIKNNKKALLTRLSITIISKKQKNKPSKKIFTFN